jgi:hypothetical protein
MSSKFSQFPIKIRDRVWSCYMRANEQINIMNIWSLSMEGNSSEN